MLRMTQLPVLLARKFAARSRDFWHSMLRMLQNIIKYISLALRFAHTYIPRNAQLPVLLVRMFTLTKYIY